LFCLAAFWVLTAAAVTGCNGATDLLLSGIAAMDSTVHAVLVEPATVTVQVGSSITGSIDITDGVVEIDC
jgi:hypothetical protein